MATVFDVAAEILKRAEPISHMKLQKLVYYSQAWSLVWEDKPLFSEAIEAWANGPVVKPLFSLLQGKFAVTTSDLASNGNAAALTDTERDTVERVLKFYGDKSSQWLSDLTHMESPWQQARVGIPPGERANNVITLASMSEYYGSL